MSQRRVVITGLGQVSPVGNSVAEAWNNLLAGKSGIGKITRFDASDINSQIAGEVRDFNIGDYISAKEARRMDVFIHYGIAAALQAIADSGLDDVENLDKDRVGVNNRLRHRRPAQHRSHRQSSTRRRSTQNQSFLHSRFAD